MKSDSGLQMPKPLPMNWQEQYLELCRTVKCKLAPSQVHGVGVFAIRDIAKGERVFCQMGVRPQWYTLTATELNKFDAVYPEIKQLIIDRWPQVVNGEQFLSPNFDARLVSFMNHSDTPNYDPITDSATRDITKDEELFEDYRIMPHFERAFPWLKPVESATEKPVDKTKKARKRKV